MFLLHYQTPTATHFVFLFLTNIFKMYSVFLVQCFISSFFFIKLKLLRSPRGTYAPDIIS